MRRRVCVGLAFVVFLYYNETMKYKLIVSDFDGTLCRSDNTVSEHSRAVIDEYFKRGGVFTLSSGRNTISLRSRLVSAGLEKRDIPLLGLQGSVIEDSLTGKVLETTTLGKEKTLWFAGVCERLGLYYHVYTPTEIYSSSPNEYSDFYTNMTGVGMKFVGSVKEFIEKSDSDFVKLFAVAEKGMNVTLARELKKQAPSGVELFTSGPFFFECISSLAGKGNGLRKAAALLGVDISETVAFGDEMNDKSALEAAGLGVAMGNARDELKAVADIVAPTNDEDGVAQIIEKYCL